MLCVDLDGTLLLTDSLHEQLVRLLSSRPQSLWSMVGWLRQGRAHFKAEVASRVELDPALLPYNPSLLAYLQEQKQAGRRLVLATAAHRRVAEPIAAHLGLFDDVMCTDGEHNLRGPAKADALRQRFGEQGYSYVGNDAHDLPVWAGARRALVVSADRGLPDRVDASVERVFEAPRAGMRDVLSAVRVQQWAKNVLVFVPLVTAGLWQAPAPMLAALYTFVLFSLVASGVYLLNDVADLDADRRHERKRTRPLAAGRLPLLPAAAGGAVLILCGLGGAALAGASLSMVLLAYVALTTAYTSVLKTWPLVDVFALAGLYSVRIVAGSVAVGVPLSIWLLSFSGLLFLSLAFLKRYVETSDLERQGRDGLVSRRGYFAAEHQLLMTMGIASSFAAAIVLSLYVDNDTARAIYGSPLALWALVPLTLFWLCRLWLAAGRGCVDDDPVVYAARDWVSRLVLVAGAAIYLYALLVEGT